MSTAHPVGWNCRECDLREDAAMDNLARAEKAEAERDEAIRHVRALMEQELVPGIRDVAGEAASAFLARVSEEEQ